MGYDLSQVLKETLSSVEESVGKFIGVSAGNNITMDGTKNQSNAVSEGLANLFKGLTSGFTSTTGGQAVVQESIASGAQNTAQAIATHPLTWIGLGGLLLFLATRKK